MMACRRCGAGAAAECQCAWDDSDCIEVAVADGVATPSLILDPDEANILECTPSGLLATMRDRFIIPTARRSRSTNSSVSNGDTITFTGVDYDDYTMAVIGAGGSVLEAAFDGKWRVTAYAAFAETTAYDVGIGVMIDFGAGYVEVARSIDYKPADLAAVYVNFTGEYALSEGDPVYIKALVPSPQTITAASLTLSFVSL